MPVMRSVLARRGSSLRVGAGGPRRPRAPRLQPASAPPSRAAPVRVRNCRRWIASILVGRAVAARELTRSVGRIPQQVDVGVMRAVRGVAVADLQVPPRALAPVDALLTLGDTPAKAHPH